MLVDTGWDDAVRFSCANDDLVTFGMCASPERFDTLQTYWIRVRRSVGHLGEVFDQDPDRTRGTLINLLDAREKDENLMLVLGVSRRSYDAMTDHIARQETAGTLAIPEYYRELSNDSWRWAYVIDRLLRYEGSVLHTRYLKGWIDAASGDVMKNERFATALHAWS